MGNNDKSGTMFAGIHPSIYCPRCGKPAARMEYDPKTDMAQYLHFTKKRSKWHTVALGQNERS